MTTLDKAKTELMSAHNHLADEFDRITKLVDNGLIPSNRMDNTQSYLNELETALKHTVNAIDTIK